MRSTIDLILDNEEGKLDARGRLDLFERFVTAGLVKDPDRATWRELAEAVDDEGEPPERTPYYGVFRR